MKKSFTSISIVTLLLPIRIPFCVILTALYFGLFPIDSLAASLSITPATGVYTTGKTFTVSVVVNTDGKSINAADGTLSFNPKELTVVGVGRGSSIFSLWTAEPTFSNAGGTITFSGGLPSGYTGGAGSVMSVTFKSLTSGAARVAISGGSVLAADGRGTNVLTNMNGGSYTLAAVETQPTAEVIVEYVAPANTPAAPVVTSQTHPDQNTWYQKTNAVLAWKLPAGVTGVRTLLDTRAVSVPTKVYDNPISTISLTDLPEGISYFHVQIKNADGWGRVAHYKLAIDSKKPERFSVAIAPGSNAANPQQQLALLVQDATSPALRFKVQLNGATPFDFVATTSSSTITLPPLAPGYHTVVIEAFDGAGNSIVSSFSFTIESFEKPVFTEYPTTLGAGVIPAIKGMTKAGAKVTVTLSTPQSEPKEYSVTAASNGVFTFIPENAFTAGVYTLTAVATDVSGARSEQSDAIKINVTIPGYLVVGSFLVSILSVLIPLIALFVLAWFMVLYFIGRIRTLRAKVLLESREVEVMLLKEFAHIRAVLVDQETKLLASRKTSKLTLAEEELIQEVESALTIAESRVTKEVNDVTRLVSKK